MFCLRSRLSHDWLIIIYWFFFQSNAAEKHNSTSNHNNNLSSIKPEVGAPTTAPAINPTSNSVSSITTTMNNITLKEKQNREIITTNGSLHHNSNENHHNSHDSNKIMSEKLLEKEKQVAVIKSKPKELDGYVGFANLPNQVYRKAVKKGFEFTLMVVGESGLGKSTLINSMFLSDVYNQDQHPGPSFRAKKTVAVENTKVMLKENGVNLTLTVVDTPGFGDAVDNSNW